MKYREMGHKPDKPTFNIFYDFLLVYFKRPPMYLGNDGMRHSYHFFKAFCDCFKKYGFSEECEFFVDFPQFVMQKYNVTHTEDFSKIFIFFTNSLREAQDLFYEDFKEYMKNREVKVTNSCLNDLPFSETFDFLLDFSKNMKNIIKSNYYYDAMWYIDGYRMALTFLGELSCDVVYRDFTMYIKQKYEENNHYQRILETRIGKTGRIGEITLLFELADEYKASLSIFSQNKSRLIEQIRENPENFLHEKSLQSFGNFMHGYYDYYKHLNLAKSMYFSGENDFFSYYYKDLSSYNAIGFVNFHEKGDNFAKYFEIYDIYKSDLTKDEFDEFLKFTDKSDCGAFKNCGYQGTNVRDFYDAVNLYNYYNSQVNSNEHYKIKEQVDFFDMFNKMKIRPAMYFCSPISVFSMKDFLAGVRCASVETNLYKITYYIDDLYEFLAKKYENENFYDVINQKHKESDGIIEFINAYEEFIKI